MYSDAAKTAESEVHSRHSLVHALCQLSAHEVHVFSQLRICALGYLKEHFRRDVETAAEFADVLDGQAARLAQRLGLSGEELREREKVRRVRSTLMLRESLQREEADRSADLTGLRP